MRTTFAPVLTVGLLVGWNAGAWAQDDARAILTRAIQAHGGEARLTQFTAEQAKARGTIYPDAKTTIAFTAETFVQLPSQFKNVMSFDIQGQKGSLIQILNGDQGWLSVNAATRPLEDQMLAETRETMYVHRISRLTTLLKDKDFQLTVLPESKVNDQPALGVKVASKGHKDVSLYFGKASGLLIKTQRQALSSAAKKDVLHEEFYSDFKDINGIKRPTKIVVNQDGKKFMEGEMLEVKPADKFPEGTFAKP